MKATSQTFDSSIDAWNNYQDAPWGKLRYRVAKANLNRHLPSLPASILDVGGGNGFDAIALAKQGYSVTVVDFSAEMLGQGRKLAAQEGLSGRITFQQADALALSQFFTEPTFSVILCHNLLQLEALELALSDKYPFYLLARFYHLIARKDGRLDS